MLALLTLLGCPLPEDKGVPEDPDGADDTGEDSPADSAEPPADTALPGDSGRPDPGRAPLIQAINFECAGGTCTWFVLSDGILGVAELDMIDNGDPNYDCGEADPDLVCGVWHEHHDAFGLARENNEYGGDTFAIELEVVDDWTRQVNNESTMFDTEIGNSLTLAVWIYDARGNYVECATAGYDPSHYAGEGCLDFGSL